MDLQTIGKAAMIAGLGVALLGGLVWVLGRVGFTSLPGTVTAGGDGWRVFVPIGASIVLSLLLTGVFWVLSWLSHR